MNTEKELTERKIEKIKENGCVECYCETPNSKVQLCEVCQEEVNNLKKQLKVIDKALAEKGLIRVEDVEKVIDKEIKSIIKLNDDYPDGVNPNFWKAHIIQLTELKQQLKKLGEK